jgi:hypothetical protein
MNVMIRGLKKEERVPAAAGYRPKQDVKMARGTGGDDFPHGPEIPWLVALGILELAYPYFREKRGVGFGQLIMKYQNGECKITRIEASPGSEESYRVQVMSSVVTIMGKDVKHL